MVISHLIAGPSVLVLAITQNGREAEPGGAGWLVALALCMLLIVDAISAVVALVGAAILRAFKMNFARCFVLIFSVVLTLCAVVLFIGAFAPEDVEESMPSSPRPPVEVE